MMNFIRSSVGKKYLMGLSGLIWAGFIFGHMAGNMLILVSPEAFNIYGHTIVSNKLLLYSTEILLVLAIVTHVACAIALTIGNRRAKAKHTAQNSSAEKKAMLGSRWMAAQGSLILVFIITHLITFKYGPYYETTIGGVVMRDLARLLDEVFHQPGYVAWYVVALLVLSFHLKHGFGSLFQSFGLLHPAYQKPIQKASWVYALVVVGGFLSQPLYVFLK
jgi:succinate dehydrogenase / fumarate reductase cytochrome b subunit